MENTAIVNIKFLRHRKKIRMRKILHYALSGTIELRRVKCDKSEMGAGSSKDTLKGIPQTRTASEMRPARYNFVGIGGPIRSRLGIFRCARPKDVLFRLPTGADIPHAVKFIGLIIARNVFLRKT